MPLKTNKEPFDVVIDITWGDQKKAIDLLESLLILAEGLPCRYRVQLGHRRPDPALQELVLRFLAEKNAQVTYALPKFDFPQELIDRESAQNHSTHRIPLGTKKSCFERNLVLLKAISELEEFVCLNPEAVILKDKWLRKVKSFTQKQSLPVQGQLRKLKFNEKIISCGWSSIGWYSGRALRRLPLEKMFRERLANPWQGMSPPGSPWQPSFCLAQEWLSAFDMPLEYVLFALYCKKKTGEEDPLAWDLHCRGQADFVQSDRPDDPAAPPKEVNDKGFVIMHEMGAPSESRKKLREHYFSAARHLGRKSGPEILAGTSLPLGGPKYSLIGNNRRKLTLDDLHHMFAGERCFIIGNGPSLNKTNLHKLKDEYTIGLNRIYLNFQKMGFQTTFLCVANPNVLQQFGRDIDQVGSVKFLRYHHEFIRNRWNTFFLEHAGFHDFRRDLRDGKWCEGCTVTYCAMQVAFFLGFETVILVGVDHNFPNSGKPHQLVTATSRDANHFHPEYFGQGIKWQYPDLAGSEVSYRVADAEFKQAGRLILDATVGGALDIFKKCEFDSLFT